jgi:hypothetical protein
MGKKTLNLYDMLWKIPGVKYLYYADDENRPEKGIIHLEARFKNKDKPLKGRIVYEGLGKNQKTKYIFDDEDLYYYIHDNKAQNILDGNFHNIEEWMEYTSHVDFPMFIDQLSRYFKNPRRCDIMVSTCAEYAFGYEHGHTGTPHVYNHDVALKDSMTVPLIIGGSQEIPNINLKYCKTTDVVPSLLSLLGEEPHKSVVGRSLL